MYGMEGLAAVVVMDSPKSHMGPDTKIRTAKLEFRSKAAEVIEH